jgi:3-oxoacyl-(acyl-carrier-protein) synthase
MLLWQGDCCPINQRHALTTAGMLSPEGRCKTLDAAADGYVRAEAAGLLLLELLGGGSGNSSTGNAGLLGVLAGSAVNQDGRSSSLTAPNGPAQQAVLRAALADAELSATQLSCLQLHGTGTPLGDPIEVGLRYPVLHDAGKTAWACRIDTVVSLFCCTVYCHCVADGCNHRGVHTQHEYGRKWPTPVGSQQITLWSC